VLRNVTTTQNKNKRFFGENGDENHYNAVSIHAKILAWKDGNFAT